MKAARPATIIMARTDPMAATLSSLYQTLSWMSPAWPIGAFAYSGGLERAHDLGWLPDCAAVGAWLRESLREGQLRSDAMAFAASHGAMAGSATSLAALAAMVLAAQAGAERTLESTAQGSAFRRIAVAANGDDHPAEIGRYAEALTGIPDDALPYPVAAAALFGAFDIALREALTAFLHGAVSNLVSAAQRIIPLGHTEAQRLLVTLQGDVGLARDAAVEMRGAPIDHLLSSATYAADIACMQHETQYTRLFRT